MNAPTPAPTARDLVAEALFRAWSAAFHAAGDKDALRAAVILRATQVAFLRSPKDKRADLGPLYSAARALLTAMGLSETPAAAKDDAAVILLRYTAGVGFGTAREQESAIRERATELIAAGVKPLALAPRVVRMLSLPPLSGGCDEGAIEKALNAVGGCDLADQDNLLDALTRIARAVGIDVKRRPKPFAAAKRK